MANNFPNNIKIAYAIANFSTDDLYAVRDEHGSKSYLYDGFYIQLLSEALNFSISFLFSNESVGRMKSDGNWTGLFGMLQRNETDFVIDGMVITEERSRVADFSPPYYITDITFLTHNPKPLPKSFAVLYPFDRRIWITIVAFFILVSVLFYALMRRTTSYQFVLLRVFGSLLEQDLQLKIRSWRNRFIVLTWIIGVMLLTYSYKGLLLSFLSFPPLIGIRDIADLSKVVAGGSHACITFKGSFFIYDLAESRDPALRVIGKSLMENSFRDFDLLRFMKFKNPDTVIITGRIDLRPYQNIFYLSRDSFLMTMAGVVVKKTFCCKKKLDEVVRRIFEAGLYEKFLRERDLKEFLKMSSNRVFYENTHVLTFDDLTSAFILLFGGHFFAAAAFVFEYFFGKMFGT